MSANMRRFNDVEGLLAFFPEGLSELRYAVEKFRERVQNNLVPLSERLERKEWSGKKASQKIKNEYARWLSVLASLTNNDIPLSFRIMLAKTLWYPEKKSVDEKTKNNLFWRFLGSIEKSRRDFDYALSYCEERLKFFWYFLKVLQWIARRFKKLWIHFNWGRLLLLREQREFVAVGEAVAAHTQFFKNANQFLSNVFSYLGHLGYIIYFFRLLVYTIPCVLSAYREEGAHGAAKVGKRESLSIWNDLVWAGVGLVTTFAVLSLLLSTWLVVGLYLFDVINIAVHSVQKKKEITKDINFLSRENNGIYGNRFSHWEDAFYGSEKIQNEIKASQDEFQQTIRLLCAREYLSQWVMSQEQKNSAKIFLSAYHQMGVSPKDDDIKELIGRFLVCLGETRCRQFINEFNTIRHTSRVDTEIEKTDRLVFCFIQERALEAGDLDEVCDRLSRSDKLNSSYWANEDDFKKSFSEAYILFTGMLLSAIGVTAYLLTTGTLATTAAVATTVMALLTLSPLAILGITLIAVGASVVIAMCIARVVRQVIEKRKGDQLQKKITMPNSDLSFSSNRPLFSRQRAKAMEKNSRRSREAIASGA